MSSEQPDRNWAFSIDHSLRDLADQLDVEFPKTPENQNQSPTELVDYDIHATLVRQLHARVYSVAHRNEATIDQLLTQAGNEQVVIERNAVNGVLEADPQRFRDAYQTLGWDFSDIEYPSDDEITPNALWSAGARTFLHTDRQTRRTSFYSVEEGAISCISQEPATADDDATEYDLTSEQIQALCLIAEVSKGAIQQAYEAVVARLRGGEEA